MAYIRDAANMQNYRVFFYNALYFYIHSIYIIHINILLLLFSLQTKGLRLQMHHR
jgi:hypothetical protein